MAQSKALLARAEAPRNDELKRLGVEFAEPRPPAASSVLLARERLSGPALIAAKSAAVQKIAAAEPPRLSITGSFRSHDRLTTRTSRAGCRCRGVRIAHIAATPAFGTRRCRSIMHTRRRAARAVREVCMEAKSWL